MADVLAAPVTDSAPAPAARARSARTALPVLEGGLATTVLTIAGLYWLNHKGVDFNPMGYYADYVLPMGAIGVGLLAGLGYGVMSWVKGVRIARGLLLAVVALQLLAYAAAEYVDYLDVMHGIAARAEADGETFRPPSFVRYYRFKAETFAWKSTNAVGGVGEPLGKWGYFFVALAAAGFVGGGLIAPLVCMALPYCAGCERYMKTRTLGFIPAAAPARKVKKADADGQAAYAAENDAAGARAEAAADGLTALALANDGPAFVPAAAAAFGPKRATNKLPVRVQTELVHCPGCGRGWLRHSAVAGQGKQVKKTVLSRTQVGPEFTTPVLQKA